MKLATKKSFKFLFVGGTILRKGPDVLLEAYLRSFTAADDVCLIIKEVGGPSVYSGQTLESRIKAAQAKANAPEIIYLTDEFLPAEMAALQPVSAWSILTIARLPSLKQWLADFP